MTVTLTTVLNSSAFDRLLVLHYACAAAVNVTLDDGTKKLADAVAVPANTPYDFGPFFLPNGTSLRGGASAATGDWVIDELRVNQ